MPITAFLDDQHETREQETDRRINAALHLLRTTCARLHAPYDDKREAYSARRCEIAATVATSRGVLLPLLEEIAAERCTSLTAMPTGSHIARAITRDIGRLRLLDSELRTTAEAWYASPTTSVTASLRRTMYLLHATATAHVTRERTVLRPLDGR